MRRCLDTVGAQDGVCAGDTGACTAVGCCLGHAHGKHEFHQPVLSCFDNFSGHHLPVRRILRRASRGEDSL